MPRIKRPKTRKFWLQTFVFRDFIEKLFPGDTWTDKKKAAASFFGVYVRTVEKWIEKDGPPKWVAMLLKVISDHKLKLKDVDIKE